MQQVFFNRSNHSDMIIPRCAICTTQLRSYLGHVTTIENSIGNSIQNDSKYFKNTHLSSISGPICYQTVILHKNLPKFTHLHTASARLIAVCVSVRHILTNCTLGFSCQFLALCFSYVLIVHVLQTFL